MAKGVPFVQITMLFMQAIFKYCAKYTIIYLLKKKRTKHNVYSRRDLYD